MNQEQKVVLGTAAVLAVLFRHRGIKGRKARKKRRMWVRDIYLQRKNQGFFDNLVAEMRQSSPELYFNFTRMTAPTFEILLSLCGPHLVKTSPREAIAPAARLIVTLRFLATGDSYPSLGYSFRIAPSTICNIVFETCIVIWKVLSPRVLKLPSTTQWLGISNNFNALWQLPNCLGSINGKHVHIKAPSHSGSLYFNYKKYFSIILLTVCNARYFFTYVNVGAYGSQSDGVVLKNSNFGQLLQDGLLNIPKGSELPNTNDKVPFYFVGDEAFPLQINLMRPYSKKRTERLGEDQLIFNYRLSRARRTIENTLGIMVSRFRIYHRTINADPGTVDVIIKATTCLHNFIKMQQVDSLTYCGREFVDREVHGCVIPGQWRRDVSDNSALGHSVLRFGNRNFTKEAFNFRDYLKDYLNEIGSVTTRIH